MHRYQATWAAMLRLDDIMFACEIRMLDLERGVDAIECGEDTRGMER